MKKLILLLFIFIASIIRINAQVTDNSFKANIFKYSKDAQPFSLAFGAAVGTGSLGTTAGFVVDLDVYHIFIGFQNTKYGYTLISSILEAKTNSLYFGYQFRNEIFMASIAGGIGNVQNRCTSGTGSNCYNVDESKRQSKVFKVEADVLLSTYMALGISYNSINTNTTDLESILLNIKFGLFREDY